MKHSFIAKQIKSYEEDGVKVLSLADKVEDHPENYIILSRIIYPEDNTDLGAYIECNFGVNGYLVSSITMKETKIVFYVKDEAIDEIEVLLDEGCNIDDLRSTIAQIAQIAHLNIE